MPKTDQIVINTGPILALIAGLGDLKILSFLYEQAGCSSIETFGYADDFEL